MARPALRKRHPLCPDCGYDVSGQVEARRMRCPECGAEFDESELRLQRLPGDWTPWGGLGRAAASLGLRSLAFVPAWALLAAWAGPFLDAGTGLRSLLLLAIAGWAIGLLYGRGVVERAGFVSGLVTVLASACCLGALAAAVGIAALWRPIPFGAASMLVGAPWLLATAAIAKVTLVDD